MLHKLYSVHFNRLDITREGKYFNYTIIVLLVCLCQWNFYINQRSRSLSSLSRVGTENQGTYHQFKIASVRRNKNCLCYGDFTYYWMCMSEVRPVVTYFFHMSMLLISSSDSFTCKLTMMVIQWYSRMRRIFLC